MANRIGELNTNWKGGKWSVQGQRKYMRDYINQYNQNNREHILANRKENSRKNREKKAGVPMAENCEACGIPANELKRGLFFDHNHRTGLFRGWLCNRCNIVLGCVDDNPDVLSALINYLSNKKA